VTTERIAHLLLAAGVVVAACAARDSFAGEATAGAVYNFARTGEGRLQSPITHRTWGGAAPHSDTHQERAAASGSSGLSIVRSFDGLGDSLGTPVAPPLDVNGDVGSFEYVQVINGWIAVFSKAGTVVHGPARLGSLWSGNPSSECSGRTPFDPSVRYDAAAERWIVLFAVEGRLCMAVSTTDDPGGTYFLYEWAHTAIDYPQLGIGRDAYLMSFNASTYSLCALDRTAALAGRGGNIVCFSQSVSPAMLPSDLAFALPRARGSPARQATL
jgi:hypothetical protein